MSPPAVSNTLKVILVGSSGVGKTSLVSAYFNNPVDGQALPTVAPASCSTTIVLDSDRRVELQIWDTAGQERFQAISQMFYRDSQVAFVCYDSDTVDTVENWINKVISEVPECYIYIVRNKSDSVPVRDHARVIEEGNRMVDQFKAKEFFFTSATNGSNVQELFTSAARCIDLISKPNEPSVDIGKSGSKGQSCC